MVPEGVSIRVSHGGDTKAIVYGLIYAPYFENCASGVNCGLVTASEISRFAFIASGKKAPTVSAMPKMNIPAGIAEDADRRKKAPNPTAPSQKIIKSATNGCRDMVTSTREPKPFRVTRPRIIAQERIMIKNISANFERLIGDGPDKRRSYLTAEGPHPAKRFPARKFCTHDRPQPFNNNLR
jgi:hypothetical protein